MSRFIRSLFPAFFLITAMRGVNAAEPYDPTASLHAANFGFESRILMARGDEAYVLFNNDADPLIEALVRADLAGGEQQDVAPDADAEPAAKDAECYRSYAMPKPEVPTFPRGGISLFIESRRYGHRRYLYVPEPPTLWDRTQDPPEFSNIRRFTPNADFDIDRYWQRAKESLGETPILVIYGREYRQQLVFLGETAEQFSRRWLNYVSEDNRVRHELPPLTMPDRIALWNDGKGGTVNLGILDSHRFVVYGSEDSWIVYGVPNPDEFYLTEKTVFTDRDWLRKQAERPPPRPIDPDNPLTGAVDPFIPGHERGRFLAAAGADGELTRVELEAPDNAFARPFDQWDTMIRYDANSNGTLDWFEVDAYRRYFRTAVIVKYDADGDGRLSKEEHQRASEDLKAGKIEDLKLQRHIIGDPVRKPRQAPNAPRPSGSAGRS